MFVLKLTCVLFLVHLVYTDELQHPGMRAMSRVYDECQKSEGGFMPCLKKKTVTFMDRVGKIDTLNIYEGLKFVRGVGSSADNESIKPLTETELEQSLPRGLEARDEALTNMLLERVSNFFSSRTVQVTLPKVTPEEIGRGIEEGRGKMKKMMGMMMMGFAMKMAAMIPVAIAGLYLLAGKALIVSKIALLLAGIIGLKKLLSGKQGGGGGGGGGGWSSGGQSGGWSSGGGGGGHGGGWDRRSLDAQLLAYNGHTSSQ